MSARLSIVGGHGVVGVVKRYGVGIALTAIILTDDRMAIDLCRIGDNDARILGDGHVWDSF